MFEPSWNIHTLTHRLNYITTVVIVQNILVYEKNPLNYFKGGLFFSLPLKLVVLIS